MTHLITPPPELVREWNQEAIGTHFEPYGYSEFMAIRAAQWAADQELEACCEWLRDAKNHGCGEDFAKKIAERLRAARRPPRPPSAIEKVEKAQSLVDRLDGYGLTPTQWDVIRAGLAEGRRALEALPDD